LLFGVLEREREREKLNELRRVMIGHAMPCPGTITIQNDNKAKKRGYEGEERKRYEKARVLQQQQKKKEKKYCQ
jgi:hypothetical protein